MAVVQNPVIGRSKKKLSNVVFSTWKGINTLRSKPLEVANPRTPAQVTQREKMAAITAIARQVKLATDIGFIEQAVRKSSFNAFVQENIGKLVPPNNVVANTFLFAKGSLSSPRNFLAEFDSPTNLACTWDSTIQPGENGTDVFICVLCDLTLGINYPLLTTSTRADGSANISFSTVGSSNYWCFGFFASADYRKASNSVWVAIP